MSWWAGHWDALGPEFERIEKERMETIPAVIGTSSCSQCNKWITDAQHLRNQHELDLGTIRQMSRQIASLEREAKIDAETKVGMQQEIERLRINSHLCGYVGDL